MKPHKGYLRDAIKRQTSEGPIYIGVFDGHPKFDGRYGYTSLVVHDEIRFYPDGCFEIETLNSRYTVEPRRRLSW